MYRWRPQNVALQSRHVYTAQNIMAGRTHLQNGSLHSHVAGHLLEGSYNIVIIQEELARLRTVRTLPLVPGHDQPHRLFPVPLDQLAAHTAALQHRLRSCVALGQEVPEIGLGGAQYHYYPHAASVAQAAGSQSHFSLCCTRSQGMLVV